MEILKDKKVLFIAPKFYSYHTQIINFMEFNGANITFIEEDIYTPLYRFLNRIFPKFADCFKQKYRNKILDTIEINSFDYVFVIRGGILNVNMIKALKVKLQNAKFIMYQWDSNKQSNYKNIIEYFNIVKTFDREDATNFNIEYLPLYYSNEYEYIAHSKTEKLYDIVFYGAYHSDRLDIIKYIDNFCRQNNLNFKHHLYITKMALVRLFLSGTVRLKDIAYLKTYSVPMNQILDIYKQSFAVLDIELNIQNGLTMRTFESLGAGLKLITTNFNILDEPFYNENNITILDRKNLYIDLNFFQTPFIEDKNFIQYSFEHWICNLFKDITDSYE